jgi:cytochrome c oxidase subunit 3
MVVGVGLLSVLLARAYRDTFGPKYNTPVDMVGLYWHFVDIIWIYLFPLLYLIDRHGPTL